MTLFDVYPLFDIEPVKASGVYLWDKNGKKYLDFYGGHAVISIGHCHPHYIATLSSQLANISFYSNSVKIPQQEKLAEKLGQLSGYGDYQLFLCNSGAEANENAIKLASFHNKRKKVIAFSNSFHGRTSLAVAATNDKSIVAPVNDDHDIIFLPFNNENAFLETISEEICAVIIEGIQGVGGIQVPSQTFLRLLRGECKRTGALLILDEIQSGYGRTGKFFAHQHFNIQPDIITVAKGMGNGFPVAGVLIHPAIKPKYGMLGTTFGGNHLACAASIAVLDVLEKEELMQNAILLGEKLFNGLHRFQQVKSVRGKGLMIGVDVEGIPAEIRRQLLNEHHIFTGYSSSSKTIRLLPPLNITEYEVDIFLHSFQSVLYSQKNLIA
jgi:acetylornithine/N-succinyldiaminopimelate aminotransferase